MMNKDFFDQIKGKSLTFKQTTDEKIIPGTIFFQIYFPSGGAALRVVDKKGRPWFPDYFYYYGAERKLLKKLQSIKEKEQLSFNWEQAEEEIYLHSHGHVLHYLADCPGIVDENLAPLTFSTREGELNLVFTREDGMIQTKTLFGIEGENQEDFQFLSEEFVLSGHKIYPVVSPGENYMELGYFDSRISTGDIEKFLSLYYSFFENIKFNYGSHDLIKGGIKEISPALIFEKIDSTKNLYLKVAHTVEELGLNFMEDFDISRIVTFNELDNNYYIRDLLYTGTRGCVKNIEKKLKKHQTLLKDNKEFAREGNLFIIDENLAKTFIFEELTLLLSEYPVYGEEKLGEYKIAKTIPRLNLKVSSGIDFLEGTVDLDFNGETISLMEVLNQYGKKNYISLKDGTSVLLNRSYISKLKRIFKTKGTTVTLSFFDLPLVDELINEKNVSESFKRSRAIFKGFNQLEKQKTPLPRIQGTLRDYQKKGVIWMNYLNQHSLGGCLADDMGLGKTIQALTLLKGVESETPSLIIMPKSLLFNWENEIARFTPDFKIYRYHGPGRDWKEAVKNDLILSTYSTVKNDIKTIKETRFYYIILDESQNIKNLESQNTKAIMLLKSEQRLALSGTPLENNITELYSLFRFLNPGMFGSFSSYRKDYITPIQNNDKEALGDLKKRIYPFILRRLKSEVARDLPEKIEQILYVDMAPSQQTFYEQRRIYYKNLLRTKGVKNPLFLMFQGMNELRKIATIPEVEISDTLVNPKRELLMEQLSDAINNKHKALVFTNYLNVIELIGGELDHLGVEYLTLTGATRNREKVVNRFQKESRYKVLLMTLKTGGVGLNLTAADYVFIFDPWWNVAAEHQALDRAHRIGQKNNVFSYKLITRGTIEEKILQLQEQKKELFQSLISSDSGALKSLSEEDIEFLLGE